MKVIFGNMIQKKKYGLILIKRLPKKKKFLHREPQSRCGDSQRG